MNSRRLDYLLEQLKTEGNDPFLQYGIAMEYLTIDRSKALEFLTNTQVEFPDYLPVYYQLALLLEEKEETEDCKRILKSGIDLAKRQADHKTLNELKTFLTNVEFDY